MIVANRGKLKASRDPAPFNAGNRQILFVNRFSYLSIVLDNELLLEPLYKNVCRQVEQKLFNPEEGVLPHRNMSIRAPIISK